MHSNNHILAFLNVNARFWMRFKVDITPKGPSNASSYPSHQPSKFLVCWFVSNRDDPASTSIVGCEKRIDKARIQVLGLYSPLTVLLSF